jgi:hypothetical protein
VYVAVSSPECRKNHDARIANITCENVEQFKYLATKERNKNLILQEIKMALESDNAS